MATYPGDDTGTGPEDAALEVSSDLLGTGTGLCSWLVRPGSAPTLEWGLKAYLIRLQKRHLAKPDGRHVYFLGSWEAGRAPFPNATMQVCILGLGGWALRDHRPHPPVLTILHLSPPQLKIHSCLPFFGPWGVGVGSLLCVSLVKPQPLLSLGFISPLTPAGQERARGWVSGCSTSLWVPLTLPTPPVLNSLPFRGSPSVLLRPCLTYPPQLVPSKLRGNVVFLDSWLQCQRLPRSPRSEASALVLGPARKPPADLQWCRRTIQLNSRLQSKQ